WNELKTLIERESPDLVGLVEVDERWLENLALKEVYPFAHENAREDFFGIALYSRFPFVNGKVDTDLGPGIPPMISTSIDIAGDEERSLGEKREIHLTLLHARPPKSQRHYYDSRLIFRRIATTARHTEGNIIVFGDFNVTPFSGFYGQLRKGA